MRNETLLSMEIHTSHDLSFKKGLHERKPGSEKIYDCNKIYPDIKRCKSC